MKKQREGLIRINKDKEGPIGFWPWNLASAKNQEPRTQNPEHRTYNQEPKTKNLEPKRGVSAMFREKSIFRKVTSLVICELLILWQMDMALWINPAMAETNEQFTQTDWFDGSSDNTATHPTNQANWTNYKSKEDTVFTGAAGKITLSAATKAIVDDADTDFTGTATGLDIIGTGAAAKLQVKAETGDPFEANLGVWKSYPQMPSLSGNSAYAKAGNYVYALWSSWGARTVFGRWDIVNKKWDFMVDFPVSISDTNHVGTSLCYPVTGDYIYALRGGATKDFYRYSISGDAWTKIKDVPKNVYVGAGLGAKDAANIFAVIGNYTAYVYKYVVATDAWVQVQNIPYWSDQGPGGNAAYPGTGDYLYVNRGQNSASWAKYNMAANSWTNLTATPVPYNMADGYAIMVYPGAGNYIYFRDNYGGMEFFRYNFVTPGWEKSPTDLSNIIRKNYWSRGTFYYATDGSNPKVHYLSGFNYGDTIEFDLNTSKWEPAGSPADLPQYTSNMTWDGGDYLYLNYCSAGWPLRRYSISENRWSNLPTSGIPERLSCSGFGSIYFNGYVYIAEGRCCSRFWRYNVSTNVMSAELARRPGDGNHWARGPMAPLTYNSIDYIYSLHGRNSKRYYRYDIAANAWTQMADIPTNASSSCEMVYPGTGDFVYAISSGTDFYKYSVSGNTWTQLANLPFNVNGACCRGPDPNLSYPGTGDYIYFIQGTGGKGFARYSITGNTWETLPSVPAPDYTMAAAAAGNYVYFLSSSQGGMFRYDITAGQWGVLPDITENGYGVYSGGAVYVPSNDTVYYFTGHRDSGVYSYVWKLDLSDKKFTGLLKAPFYMSYGTKAFYPGSGEDIYIVEGKRTVNSWKFNITTGAFTQLANLPFAVGYGGALTGDTTLLYATRGDDTKTFMKYDIAGNTWTQLADTPETIATNSDELNNLVKAGSYVYCLRAANTGTFWMFDPDSGMWTAKTGTPVNFYSSTCLYYPGSGDFLYAAEASNKYFYKYSIANNAWTRIANIPRMGLGGGLFYPGSGDIIYSLPGTWRADLQRYSIANDTWDQPLELMTPSYGAAMVALYDGDTIFYRNGGGQSWFSKYSISTRTATGLAGQPWNVDEWSARMTTDGTSFVYATRGRNRSDFAKYNVATNAWTALTAPAATFLTGHDIVCKGAYVWAIRGGSQTFWRYDPNANTWGAKADVPAAVNWGGRLVAGDGSYIYCVQGAGTDAFYRYNTTTNTWATLAELPLTIARNGNDASALCYPGFGDYIYYAPGTSWSTSEGESKIFLRYSISQNKWEELPSSPAPFRSNFDIVYPGLGKYLYADMGYGDTEMMSYMLYAEGTYISTVKDIGNNNTFGTIDWSHNGLGGIEVKIRTAANKDMSDAKSWLLCVPVIKGSNLTDYDSIVPGQRYLQYRVRLLTEDFTKLSALDNITINVKYYPQKNELVSSAYNSTFANNRLMKLAWTKTQPSGSNVRYQLRTSPTQEGLGNAQWLGPAGTQEFLDNYSNEADYAYAPQIEVTSGVARLKKVLEEYAYSQRIMLDNSAGTSSLVNFVITLNLTSANKDFWAHVKSDGSDVRFADSSSNILGYNLATGAASFDYANKTAKIYVKVPLIPAGEKDSIFMKYGKADATSASDPLVTPIYADFSGTTVNTSKFDYGTSSGAVTQNDNIQLTSNNTWTYSCLISKDTVTRQEGDTFTFQIKPESTGNNTFIGVHNSGTSGNPGNFIYGVYFNSNGWVYVFEDDNNRSNKWTYASNTWYDIKIVLKAAGATYFYKPSTSETWTQFYDSNYSSATPLKMGISHYSASYKAWTDNWNVLNSAGAPYFSAPYFSYSLQENATSAFLSGWDKRLTVRVDNTQGGLLLSYQAKVTLDASQESFWAACKSDGSDIRFVDSDNSTVLNYYRDSFDYTNKAAALYVKIPQVPAGQEKTVYLYYGRQDASDTTNFAGTKTKNFNEFLRNASGIALDGIDDKAAAPSSDSLNITGNVTLEAQVKYDIDYWPDGWGYRKKVTLNNTAGTSKAQAVVQFDVPYQTEMKADYSDLRFYETDHSSKLRHRIVSYDGTKATVYVSIKPLLAGSSKDIYMYYGNAAAASESDTTFFPTYAEFSGSTIDSAALAYGGGTITQNDTLMMQNDAATWDCYLTSKDTWAREVGKTFLFKVKPTSVSANTMVGIHDSGTGASYADLIYAVFFYPNSWIYIYEDGTQKTNNIVTYAANTWYDIKIVLKAAGATYYIRPTGTTPWTTLYDSVYSSETPLKMGIAHYDSAYAVYTDDWDIEGSCGSLVSLSPTFDAQQTPPSIIRWLPGFAYRQKITIDNTAGSNYDEVLAQIEIPYQSGKMKADYSDLRFVGPEGKLNYQIISYDGTKAFVGVNVKGLLKAKKDIWVYYGNANALSEGASIGLNEGIGFSTSSNFDYGPQITANSNTQITFSSPGGCTTDWRWYWNYKAKDFKRADSPSLYFRFNEVSFRCYRQEGLVGWKDTSATQTINAFKHGIYFSNSCNSGGIKAIEAGAIKGTTMTYSRGSWYEGKITLKPSGGATYYARANGASAWTLLYDSTAGADTDLRVGADFNSCRNSAGYQMSTKEWAVGYQCPESVYAGGTAVMLTAYGTPSVVTFAGEEAQPAIDQTVIGKSGAYALKFTNDGLTATVNSTSVSTLSYDVNKWMHAALVYDGANIKLLVNGSQKAQTALAGAITTNANGLIIGDKIRGSVDEPRVWNIPRTAGGIIGDRLRCLTGNETGLVMYLKCNENTGTTAADATANVNSASLEAGAGWYARPFAYSNEKAMGQYHCDDGAGLSVADSSGNTNTLTATNVSWASEDLTGYTGDFSVNLNGTNAYLQAADSATLDCANAVTLAAWIKPQSVSDTQIIVDKGDDAANIRNYALYLLGANVVFSFYSNGAYKTHATTSGSIEALNKYHVAATFDEATQKVNIYVNGALVYTNTTAETARMSTNNKPLLVGKSVAGNYYKGLLDEVRVYNRALTANEVMRHYEERQYSFFEPEPVLYFDYEPETTAEIAVYYKKNPVVQPIMGVFYNNSNIEDFVEVSNKPYGTEIKYQISPDGYNWYYHDGTNWTAVTGGYSQANTATGVKNKLADFQANVTTSGGAAGTGDFYYRAYLHSDESSFNTPSLDLVKIILKTGDTFYVDSAGSAVINSAHSDASNDQWYQYKAILYSDGTLAPLVDDVTVDYIKAFITVTAPNGGEFFPAGEHTNITWNAEGITGATNKVKLEYSTDGGSIYNSIAAGVSNTGTYDWTVPDDSSANTLVKVTSEDFEVVSDTSDAAFKISSLVVTSPNGGEVWESGKQHTVRWTTSGAASNNLTIQYSTNGGSTWINIATQRPNTGTYTWYVPSATSINCMVKIFDASNNKISDTSDAAFTMIPQPALTITAPAGGETWAIGTSKTISWRTNQKQFCDTVDMEYSADDFATAIPIQTGVSIGTPQGADMTSIILGTYDWTVPDAPGSNIKVRVKESSIPQGRDTQTKVTAVSGAITISQPTITLTAPTAQDIWIKGDAKNITWTSDGAISDNLKLEYSTDGGSAWTEIAAGEANDGTYAWTIPTEAVSNTARLKITDLDRPSSLSVSPVFMILANPKISVTQPNGGESLTIGTTYEVRWQTWGNKLASGGADYNAINLYYSTDSGATWTLITDQQSNTGSFVWSVPDAASSQCMLKISDNNDAQIYDISDAIFSIVLPTITVTAPNGGEQWYATGTYNITWDTTGAISNNMKLEYSTDSGSTWTTIVEGQGNTRTYAWPAADADTGSALIRISDGNRLAVNDTSDAVFTITPPSITLLAPNGNEEWPVGTDQEIRWTSSGKEVGAISDNLTLQYSSDGGSTWTDITAALMNNGTYMWTIPDAVSTTCKIKIFDAGRTATEDVSDANFKICLPYIEVLTPNGGEVWAIGTDQAITWRAVGAISDNLTLEYSTNNFSTATTIATAEANDGTYTWTVPDDYSLSAKVRVTDGARTEIKDASDGIFAISNPIITVTRPNGGDLFSVGDTEAITWECVGSVSNNLKIEYSKDNFVTAGIIIADGAPNTGTYDWTVPNDISATIRVRITDKDRPLTWDKSDANFTILPAPVITLTAPNGEEVWRLGKAYNITWTDNGGKISNNLTLQYSVNAGGAWTNIATGVSNSHTYSWTIPDNVSATCLVKIFDASRPSTVDSSDANFRIADPLIAFTSPAGGEEWAVGDRANITWATEGTVSDTLVIEFSADGGLTYSFVATVTNSGSYAWTVPDYITSAAYIRIKDVMRLATNTVSSAFTIIGMPTITITSPSAGDSYVLGEEVPITWTWTGLSISNNLLIEVSSDNFVSSRQVIGIGQANDGAYTWNLTGDALTGQTLKVRITDGNRTEINAISDGYFRVRGGFTLTKPNGGENWGAKSPQTITWETRGNIPTVKLEYTLDDGAHWSVIAAAATNNNSYAWTLPDLQTTTCKVRVSQPDDATVTDMSNDPFGIVYFTVKFNVLDYDTLQHMNELNVNEPSTGWSDTSVTSPFTRTLAYPYGTYTTFVSKTNFIDNSATWTTPKEGTAQYVVTAYLENSASAQVSWESIFSYSYSPADDLLNAVGSLQRKGKLVGTSELERLDMGAAVVTIYEPNGTTIRKTLTSTAPNTSGTYTFTYSDTDFEAGKVYPAQLSVEYRERPYVSTANIDVGSEILQYEFFTQTAKKLGESVETIEAAVAGGTSQTRADIETSRLQTRSDIASSRLETKSDIEASRQQIVGDLEETRTEIAGDIASSETTLKSHVTNILTTAETAIKTKVDEAKAQVATAMKTEILNTESAVRTGETLMIRYRTYSGLAPIIDVYSPDNVLELSGQVMKEINLTGIYEYALAFDSGWGKGDFTIVCSEPTKGTLDALILTVISTDLEQVGNQVAAIMGATSSITTLKAATEAMSSQFSVLETALGKMSKDLVNQVKEATGSVSAFESVFSQLNSLSTQIKEMAGESSVNLAKLYDVSSEKKNDMNYLKNKTQELKAAMEINMKMMDNVANKPVTQTWYEYK